MFSIESKLYRILSNATRTMAAVGLFIVLSLPLYTLPLAVAVYGRMMANIVNGRGMFDFRRVFKQSFAGALSIIPIGFCLMYAINILAAMNDSFVGALMIAFLISFWFLSAAAVFESNGRILASYRFAFFYSAAKLHRTVLPIFLLIQFLRRFYGFPIYLVLGSFCAASFFWFRVNRFCIDKDLYR